jgi:hypothetical protein
MMWLLPHPLPLSRQQVVSLSPSYCVSLVEFTDGRMGGGKGGDGKTYDSKKGWSFTYHSIFSGEYGPFSKYWDWRLVDDKT